MDDSKPPQPVDDPADAKAQRVRERAMDLLASAAVHAQRLDAAARRIGLTPDLVDGVGDHLYEAAIAQLDVVSKILERSQVLADRLLDLAVPRGREPAQSRFQRIDASLDQPTRIDLVIRNPDEQAATVHVKLDWTPPSTTPPPTWQVGQPRLPGGRETALEITIPAVRRAGVYPMLATVTLCYPGGREHTLAVRELEIWVRA
jgi:hypothetical protein